MSDSTNIYTSCRLAVSAWPVTAEVWVQSRFIRCETVRKNVALVHILLRKIHSSRDHIIPQIPILTYSMVQSPPWAANWFAASQETPRISRNPKVHYRTHKRPPLVSILGQPNPVHIPTSRLLKTHPNIIHHLRLGLPICSFPPVSPPRPYTPPSPHPYAPHAQPISFFSVLSPAKYWVRNTNHLAPRCSISSIPPLPLPS